jgi:peroxiredoxin
MSPARPQAQPTVGSEVPDFTLPSTSGAPMTLSAWRGRRNVLLAFFPLAFTSVCSREMCELYEDIDRFASAETEVFGISVDSSPTHREFQFKNGIRTELLSDFKREVSRLYGVLDEENFFAHRSYFLIDKAGVLRWKHVEADDGQKREVRDLLEQVRRLA